MRRRGGKCQWIEWEERFPRLSRSFPVPLQHKFWLSPLNRKKIRCNSLATTIANSSHFEGYNNLPVCAEHLHDVELSNKLDAAIKRGEI